MKPETIRMLVTDFFALHEEEEVVYEDELNEFLRKHNADPNFMNYRMCEEAGRSFSRRRNGFVRKANADEFPPKN